MSEALQILMKEELNEAEKKGISIGEARGRNNILDEMLAKGIISPEQAAQFKTV